MDDKRVLLIVELFSILVTEGVADWIRKKNDTIPEQYMYHFEYWCGIGNGSNRVKNSKHLEKSKEWVDNLHKLIDSENYSCSYYRALLAHGDEAECDVSGFYPSWATDELGEENIIGTLKIDSSGFVKYTEGYPEW